MSAKDIFHNAVRLALEKDNWLITHDPLFLKLFEQILIRVDLGAQKLISAEKNSSRGKKFYWDVSNLRISYSCWSIFEL